MASDPHAPDFTTLGETEAQRIARVTVTVAAQNDAFRRALLPGATPSGLPGRVVVTRSVAARGDAFVGAALRSVATDETFTEDNDPHGDHTFGALTVEGARVWWKIDLHDRDLHFGSERPDDPEATARVLTILLPEDY